MTMNRPVGPNRLNMRGPAALLGFIVLFAASAVPIFSHNFVSMNDVYNHVARAAVLARYDQDPALQQYWVPNWRFVPYVGYDLAQIGLLSWFSMAFVVKLMTAGSLMTMFAGAMLLSRAAHGKWSAAALLPALLLLNRTLLAGFINYLFGIGVSLVGAAAWIALRQRPPLVRLLVLAAFATALCAIHLFACAVLGVIIAGIELAILAERRPNLRQSLSDLAVPAVAFLPALLLVVFVARNPGHLTSIVYGSLISRIEAFAVPLTYAPKQEAAAFLAIAVVILALWITGRVSVDRRLAAAAALLALVQLAMPADIGTATVADHRIPIAFWLIALCALEIRIGNALHAYGLTLLVAGVFLFRVSLVQTRWTGENVVYNQAHQALASLPATARVATAFPASALNAATRPDVALYYMPTIETAPRGGFTQILFAIADQHPLEMRPRFRQLTAEAPPEAIWQIFVQRAEQDSALPSPAEVTAAIKQYDYVAFLYADPFEVAATALLEPVRNGLGFRIYRVAH